MTTIDAPLIILGAARSGTTMLGRSVLRHHPALAYWEEPNYVWSYGAAYRRSDVRHAHEATPAVRRYIRDRIREFVALHDGRRLLEKTPSNCFRVPFIREVLPEARFVHLVRDGRDVALSADREWRGGGDHSSLDSPDLRTGSRARQIAAGVRRWSQLRERIRDVRSAVELFANAPRLFGYVARKATGTGHIPWGPRFPGIAETRRTHTLLETCALQWQASVLAVQNACHDLGADRFLSIQYERLMAEPRTVVAEILEFAELDADTSTLDRLTSGIVQRPPLWPDALMGESLERVERLIAVTLEHFGYELSERPAVTPDDA